MLVLMLALTALPASAESIFPTIPTKMTEEAPSYALLMDIVPTKEETLEDGSLRQYFHGVSQDDFNKFGVYLGEKGYATSNVEYVDEKALATDIVKDDIVFHVLFDWVDLTLTVTYPKDLKVEQKVIPDPLAGFVELNKNDVIHVKSDSFQGTFQVSDWNINTYIKVYINFTECFHNGIIATFDFYNKDTITVSMVKQISNLNLYYINEDNHYIYPLQLLWENPYGRYCDHLAYDAESNMSIPSLEHRSMYACTTSIPQNVVSTTDGTLAIAFDFVPNNTSYVVYLRRPNEQ